MKEGNLSSDVLDSKVVSNHKSRFGGGNVKIWGNDVKVPYFLRDSILATPSWFLC